MRSTPPCRFSCAASTPITAAEFINEVVLAYCKTEGIEFTRSRPYRKNDQAWVEQKNGAVVRRLVGYQRLEGVAATEALSRLYAASRLFVNFFQPSFKLAEKKRVGARVSKRYHAPQTPCSRLLSSDAVAATTKERLSEVASGGDPLRLLDEIRTEQHRIAAIAAGECIHIAPGGDAELNTAELGDGMARGGGQADPPEGCKATAALAHAHGSIRRRLVAGSRVAGDRAGSHRD